MANNLCRLSDATGDVHPVKGIHSREELWSTELESGSSPLLCTECYIPSSKVLTYLLLLEIGYLVDTRVMERFCIEGCGQLNPMTFI